jgi:hypothetical protein
MLVSVFLLTNTPPGTNTGHSCDGMFFTFSTCCANAEDGNRHATMNDPKWDFPLAKGILASCAAP